MSDELDFARFGKFEKPTELDYIAAVVQASAQHRRTSGLEALANTLVGYGVAVGAQVVVFPWFGINIPLSESALIGVVFMGISTVRGYVLRRVFERLRVSGVLP